MEIDEILSAINDTNTQDGLLLGFIDQLNRLLRRDSKIVNSEVSLFFEVREYLWERLHGLEWNAESLEVYRNWFGLISCVLVEVLIRNSESNNLEQIRFLLRVADLGLLLGNSAHFSQSRLHEIIAKVEKYLIKSSSFVLQQQGYRQPQLIEGFLSDNDREIAVLDGNLLSSFYENYFLTQQPVLLTHVMDDWNALSKWKDLSYLIAIAGERTVPIELGSSYLSSNASVKLMTLKDYISSYILQSAPDVGYLAQHALFEQIPLLKQDFSIPDICSLLIDEENLPHLPSDQNVDQVLTQGWFGPVGTVSPLHYDSYYNIFAQIHGYKAIRLYAPTLTPNLFPLEGRMKNNSSLDLLDVNDRQRITALPYIDVLLKPGDCLFIPRWWWHHISSLDSFTFHELLGEDYSDYHKDIEFSFSINFWWGRRIEPPPL